MIEILNTIPWYILAPIVILSTIILALLGLYIVRSVVDIKTLHEHHDIAGYTFGIIGLIYGVLLGFTVVNVHDRYNTVHQIIEDEANVLIDLYRDAAVFPVETRNKIRDNLHHYVNYVIDIEWPKMVKGEKLSMNPATSVGNIWNSYYNYTPASTKEQVWYESSISKLNEFSTIRLKRLFHTRLSQSSMMWTLLILGGVTTVIFMYFFGTVNFRSQMLMTSLLTAFIVFMLFLIFSLDAVFSGGTRLEPNALHQVIDNYALWSDGFEKGNDLSQSPQRTQEVGK